MHLLTDAPGLVPAFVLQALGCLRQDARNLAALAVVNGAARRIGGVRRRVDRGARASRVRARDARRARGIDRAVDARRIARVDRARAARVIDELLARATRAQG